MECYRGGSNRTPGHDIHLRPPLPMSLLRTLLIAILASQLSANCLAQAPAQAVVEAPAPTDEQLHEWAAGLDDDQFEVRQHSQMQLEQAGPAAVDAVAQVAKAGTLESSTRAINILLKWAEQKDQTLRLEALQRIANLTNRPRESAMATRLLADVREQAALEALTELGATYNGDIQTRGIGTRLQVIIGPKWKGGYEGLKLLADVPRVSTVSFHSAPLGDRCLEALVSLPAIQRVELYGTKVSTEAIAQYKQKAPKVEVDPREGGALLGVRGNPQGTILHVVPGSAADKAGLRVGDRVKQINGEEVASFQELTQRIGQHSAGDTANLTVLRNNQTREVSVTFDQWGTVDMSTGDPFGRLPMMPDERGPIIEVQRR